MRIKINNAIVDFKYKAAEEDMMGTCELYVPKEDMIKFINENTDKEVDLNEYDAEESDITPSEIAEFSVFGQDYIIEWIEQGMEGDFFTWDTDLQIILYSCMIDESIEKEIKLEYHGENPFWLLHDICHSRHDVSGMNVYVDQYIEEERIFGGMELAKELNILSHVNGELIANVTKGFRDRWDYNFDENRAIEYLNENN